MLIFSKAFGKEGDYTLLSYGHSGQHFRWAVKSFEVTYDQSVPYKPDNALAYAYFQAYKPVIRLSMVIDLDQIFHFSPFYQLEAGNDPVLLFKNHETTRINSTRIHVEGKPVYL